jgi:hypothetical protein
MARQQKTMVRVVVWVIVIAMVLSMVAGIATIAFG